MQLLITTIICKSSNGLPVYCGHEASPGIRVDATDGNPYNLDLFAHDRANGTTVRINANRSGDSLYLAGPEHPDDVGIDVSGRRVVFGGDPIGEADPLLADLGDRRHITVAGNRRRLCRLGRACTSKQVNGIFKFAAAVIDARIAQRW